jgi:SAM-dependent methyltransferase
MSVLPLPPVELRFMAEDDERLLRTGRELAGLLERHGMRPRSTVLDVGSGYGRLALGLASQGSHTGRYVGFDILAKQVGWCRDVLSNAEPRLQFRHINARNARYNPNGTVDPAAVRFPAPIGSVDVAAAFSVFTHLHRPTIEHYLRELRRVLRPGGVAVTTWLLWDEDRLHLVTNDRCPYPLRFVLDADTRISDETDPLRAIAFRPSGVRAWAAAAGLEVVQLRQGSWDGATESDTFQDLVVLRRPDGPLQRARWLAGRAKRRIKRR